MFDKAYSIELLQSSSICTCRFGSDVSATPTVQHSLIHRHTHRHRHTDTHTDTDTDTHTDTDTNTHTAIALGQELHLIKLTGMYCYFHFISGYYFLTTAISMFDFTVY